MQRGISVRAGAVALLLALSTTAAAGQGFEADPLGSTNPLLLAGDPDFGFFSGGAVEAPGVTIPAFFALGGAHVYYGADLLYTSILGEGADAVHCCAYFALAMRLASEGDVQVDFYGHAPATDDDPWPELLLHSTILSGADQALSWGDPWLGPSLPDGADITSVRWRSLDGRPFAIDDVRGLGTAAIPEPASWALLILGFGLVGVARRRARPEKALLAG